MLLVLELMAITETRLEMVTLRAELPESENRCSLVSLSNVKLLDRARCWTSWHPNSYFHVLKPCCWHGHTLFQLWILTPSPEEALMHLVLAPLVSVQACVHFISEI